jgi:hypothetical protein
VEWNIPVPRDAGTVLVQDLLGEALRLFRRALRPCLDPLLFPRDQLLDGADFSQQER